MLDMHMNVILSTLNEITIFSEEKKKKKKWHEFSLSSLQRVYHEF